MFGIFILRWSVRYCLGVGIYCFILHLVIVVVVLTLWLTCLQPPINPPVIAWNQIQNCSLIKNTPELIHKSCDLYTKLMTWDCNSTGGGRLWISNKSSLEVVNGSFFLNKSNKVNVTPSVIVGDVWMFEFEWYYFKDGVWELLWRIVECSRMIWNFMKLKPHFHTICMLKFRWKIWINGWKCQRFAVFLFSCSLFFHFINYCLSIELFMIPTG